MNKDKAIKLLNNNEYIIDFAPFDIGQGVGYKEFCQSFNEVDENEVIYIPEYAYDENEIPDVDYLYTKKDFITLCKGNFALAAALFDCVDWQSPETLLNEWETNGVLEE